MAKNFFDKPFTEDTNVKLELYREYLKEWFPVFLAAHNPFVNIVNVFDFFCGPGKDSEGTIGSPLIALDILKFFYGTVKETEVEINLYFNDSNSQHVEQLKIYISELNYNSEKINIHFYNEDFVDLFPKTMPLMKNSANLIFLDQFGIKYINNHRFQQLIKLRVTDILFFISSSTFNRFPNDENVTKVIGLSSDEIRNTPFYDIHRLIHRKYSELIPVDYSYCLAPFSIKKGTNIYGLIFGSGHPLGMEKFLDICWKRDEETGEANFDIQGDKMKKVQPSLFGDDDKKAKIPVFQDKLENEILNGKLTSDLEVYLYGINSGFTAKHILPVIKRLKKDNKILIKYPSFKCGTVLKVKKRKPKEIILLK